MKDQDLRKTKYYVVFGLLAGLIFAVMAYFLDTGFSPFLMALFGALVGLLSFFGFTILLGGLFKLPVKVSKTTIIAVGSIVSSFLLANYLGFRFPPQLFFPISAGLIILGMIWVNALDAFRTNRSAFSLLGLIFPILICLGGIYFLYSEGSDPFPEEKNPIDTIPAVIDLASQGLSNPAEKGSYSIQQFNYGSGNDLHRSEFNEEADYLTETVDAKLMLPDWKDKKKKWRERYWGFGPEEFPINGRVHMPASEGKFPIALIVHGNHSMVDYSDEGYVYLTELLASQGIIAVSVDQNFINGHWSGDFRGKEMPTRAWLLLKHLQQWEKWNSDSKHDLYQKADLTKVMLVGHSRGGEAVSIAAAFNELSHYPENAMQSFDFNFGIKAVVSIAPTDYRYHRKINLKNINYLSLQGSYDSDEVSFWGMRPYRRLKFDEDNYFFKAGVYLHGANHGQFNETWGRKDFGPPTGWLLNTKPMMPALDQQKATQVFISAFAKSALLDDRSYLPIFQQIGCARDWLPEQKFLTHFSDSDDIILQDYEEDIYLSAGRFKSKIETENLKIWREENLKTRDGGSQDNNVVILGWDYGDQILKDSIARYSISFDSMQIFERDTINQILLEIATCDLGALEALKKSDTKNKKPKDDKDKTADPLVLDFQVQLTDALGNRVTTLVSKTKRISPILKTRFTKLKFLDKDMIGDDWEVQLETFALPLDSFDPQQGGFDISKLKSIELIFDQAQIGIFAIDNIGFSAR